MIFYGVRLVPYLNEGRLEFLTVPYYEEVLVVRVHPLRVTTETISPLRIMWRVRIKFGKNDIVPSSIMEQHLTRNGTQIIKFFLHLSKR